MENYEGTYSTFYNMKVVHKISYPTITLTQSINYDQAVPRKDIN